jgi:cytochrome c biogenesis protein CcmG, thiol:disulfide interchange protein DsbE
VPQGGQFTRRIQQFRKNIDMFKRITFLPLTIVFAVSVLFAIYLWQIGPGGKDISTLPSAMIDKPVPEFDLAPIEGRKLGLKSGDLKSGLSLVNVWASWCPPCRVEHPFLMELAEKGVTIYGINYRDKPADALRFLRNLGDPYKRIGADTTGRVSIEWGIYGYPETFLVDQTGRIRYRHVGPISSEVIENVFDSLMEKISKK